MARVQKSIDETLFPEIWYNLENFVVESNDKRCLVLGAHFEKIPWALKKQGWDVTLADSHTFKDSQVINPAKLPFASKTFPLICTIHWLEVNTDPRHTWHEVYRVCQSRGKVFSIHLNPFSLWGFHAQAILKRPMRFYMGRHKLVECLQSQPFKFERLMGKGRFIPWLPQVPLPWNGMYVSMLRKE